LQNTRLPAPIIAIFAMFTPPVKDDAEEHYPEERASGKHC